MWVSSKLSWLRNECSSGESGKEAAAVKLNRFRWCTPPPLSITTRYNKYLLQPFEYAKGRSLINGGALRAVKWLSISIHLCFGNIHLRIFCDHHSHSLQSCVPLWVLIICAFLLGLSNIWLSWGLPWRVSGHKGQTPPATKPFAGYSRNSTKV